MARKTVKKIKSRSAQSKRSLPSPFKEILACLPAVLFLLPGLYLVSQNQIDLGWTFMAAALVLAFAQVPAIRKSSLGQIFGELSPYLRYGLVWLLWVALGLCTLRFDNFGWALQTPPWLTISPFAWIQALLFLGLTVALSLNREKDKKKEPELSSFTARVWFWALIALALVMRVYRMGSPEGSYGFDEAAGIMETRLVRDLNDFRQGYSIAYYQKPIFCYITLFFWHFLPNATDLFIVRLSAVVCDLGTLWLLYLTGKEIGGRRLGVIAMTLGMASKPLLNLTAMGMGAVMVPFFTLLPLLFILRLFKDPSLRRFLQLGFVLALGIYNNDYIRIELMVFIGTLFLWILSKKENRALKGPMGWVLLVNGLCLVAYYCIISFSFAQARWIHQLFLFEDKRLEVFGGMLLMAMVLALLSYAPWVRLKSAQQNQTWVQALLGLWVCTLLDYPALTQPEHLQRIDNLINLGGGNLIESFHHYFDRLMLAGKVLFWEGTWPSNMGMTNDALFSFGETLVIFLGAASFLARPTWLKTYLVIIVVGGIMPHAFADGTHNARVAGAIGPILLLAALGVHELLSGSRGFSKGPAFYGVVLAALMGFWGWTSWSNYDRVNHQWFDHQTLYLTSAHNMAAQESALGNRVYFCPDIFAVEETVINEGLTIHQLFPHNLIYRNPADKPQDVSLILHNFSSDVGKAIQLEVEKYFPGTKWTNQDDAVYCRIPYAALLSPRQKMFEIKPEAADQWKREFMLNYCGLLFDLIDFEDRTAHVTDPVAPEYAKAYSDAMNQNVEAVRFSTTIHVTREADYAVHYKVENRSYLKIDGQKVVDLSFFKLLDYWAPAKQGEVKVHLVKGDHQVEVMTAYQRSVLLPEFSLKPAGSGETPTSLWSAFQF